MPEHYETFGETYDRPETPRRIRRPVTAKPNPHQIKPMNDKPSPTVNDIKLPVSVHSIGCAVFDNDAREEELYELTNADHSETYGYLCGSTEDVHTKAILHTLNSAPALLAERDALREALAELASFAKYVAGRGYVGNITRDVAEKNLIYRVEAAEAVLERDKARLALAKGGGE